MRITFKYLQFLILIPAILISGQKFVATNGLDTNSGSIEEPYKTITKAISVIGQGDTIYVRGGNYDLTSTISISSSKNGSENNRYYLLAYQDEEPLLDFSDQSFGSKGISLSADYWVIKGFDIKGAGDNGLQISSGSYNLIERCNFYENRDTGLQLSDGASFNQIINCDSYYNADPTDYGDADGFAPKLDVGTGNYFYGCRAWGNCDDGWDGYMRGATDVTTTLENCWTWGNGYLKDGTNPGSQANGNGFKMGGGDNSNSQNLMHHFILKNCMAFNNKNKGFDQNNNVGSMTLYNCTGFGNLTANYRILKTLYTGQYLTVKNSVSYNGSVELGAFAIEETNSWMPEFDVSSDDFLSITPSLVDAPRNEDGSLPQIEFMNLAEGSDLIDAGVDLGMPYNGDAPDLGAFESDYLNSVIISDVLPAQYQLYQNYPNPFNPITTIQYSIKKSGRVKIDIYNTLGEWVETLVDENQAAGNYTITWNASTFSSGLYFYQIECGNFKSVKRMLLIK